MLAPPPDLYDYAVLTDWVERSERNGCTYSDLIEIFLSEGTPIGFYRACIYALRIQPKPFEDITDWLRQAYLGGDEMLRHMVLAFRVNSNIRLPFIEGLLETDTPTESILVLKGILQEINKIGPHPLRLEAELRINHGLLHAHIILGDREAIEYTSLHLIALASLFNGHSIKSYYTVLRGHALAVSGQWSKSVKALSDNTILLSGGSLLHNRMSALYLSNGLMNLGGLRAALKHLGQALDLQPEDVMLLGQQQWVRALYGQSSPEEANVGFEASSQAKQIKVAQLFAAADGLAPVGKGLAQRDQLFRSVLSASGHSILIDTFESDQLFDHWVRGRARLLLGEYGIVVQELSGMSAPDPEDLYNRALLAALHLEMAMTSLNTLQVPLKEAERQFRTVFMDARSIAYADPETLAGLVGRWHPQAAAYAALMPDPLREFLPALDSIMRVRIRTTWRGQAVPAPLVPHLTRLGLRLPVLGLSVGGNVAYQIGRLARKQHDVPIWGPVVSALPLVVALARGGEEHLLIARRAWKDFGVLPAGQHGDPELEGVVELWHTVVDGERTVDDGLRALQRL